MLFFPFSVIHCLVCMFNFSLYSNIKIVSVFVCVLSNMSFSIFRNLELWKFSLFIKLLLNLKCFQSLLLNVQFLTMTFHADQ